MMKKTLRLVVLAIGLFSSHTWAASVITRSAGGAGNWADPVMWASGYIPGITNTVDNAFVRNGTTLTVTSVVPVFTDLWIGEGARDFGIVNVVTNGVLAPIGAVGVGRAESYGYGALNINGGTFNKGAGTIVVGNGGTTGIVTITSGTLICSVELGSASTNLDVGDKFSITGTTSAVSGNNLIVGNGGVIEFVFNTTGISTLNYSGTVRFYTGSQIVINGAAYTGADATFNLITAGTLAGTSFPTVILTNCYSGTTYSYNTTNKTVSVNMKSPMVKGLKLFMIK